MKLRYLAILLAFALASAVANAQAGLYGTFDAERFNRSGINAVAPAGSNNEDNPWLYGSTVGAFYTLHKIPKLGTLHTGPVNIGIDGRGDFLHGSLYTRSDGLIGLRITPKTAIMGITPYVQGSAGVGHTKLPRAFNGTNNWSYQFAVGADRKIKGQVDWRVVEVSGGWLQDFVAGANASNSNYNFKLSSGFVYRIPPSK